MQAKQCRGNFRPSWISRVMETRGWCTQALSAARTFHSRRDIQVKQVFIPPAACLRRWISARIPLLIICVCLRENRRSRFHQLGFIVCSRGFCHFKDKTIRDTSMNILYCVPRVCRSRTKRERRERWLWARRTAGCKTWVNKCAHSYTQRQFHILSWHAVFG